MRHATVCLILLTLSCGPAFAQPQAQGQSQKRSSPQPVYEGPLELPCAKILAMPSSDYIAQIVAIDDSNVDGQLRGIRRYGACYDARTDALAASLVKTGKGPRAGARADFRDFDAALKDFTAKALEAEAVASPLPPVAPVKTAYAALYEKQFRYEFYKEYEAKTVKVAKPAPPAGKSSASAAAPAATVPPAARPSAASAATAQEHARSDADPVTQAKNHFGKLLEILPDDKMHELHRAFGDVIGPHQISEATRLAVYRYAIFLLEPPSAAPFSPPPF
ncbi:MAG TPA: hypothetical protein VN792_00570 [Candidatus Acidoferrales bacterium]|jgi:hypothetical protein|nr:hypothetical protein [Candidatus Acidoferrales bacterium]